MAVYNEHVFLLSPDLRISRWGSCWGAAATHTCTKRGRGLQGSVWHSRSFFLNCIWSGCWRSGVGPKSSDKLQITFRPTPFWFHSPVSNRPSTLSALSYIFHPHLYTHLSLDGAGIPHGRAAPSFTDDEPSQQSGPGAGGECFASMI